jgi:hypothetical protein
MQSPAKESADTNLLWAVAILTAAAATAACASAYISGYVLDQLQNTEALALIVTDGGLRSDSKSLEHNMSAATVALESVRDLGWALAAGCLAVGAAVAVRAFRGREG